MLIVGIGGGNNNTTSVTKYGTITIPTIAIPAIDLDNGMEKAKKSLDRSLQVEIEGVGNYFVGDFAKDTLGTIPTRLLGARKLGDDELKIVMLTNIAMQVIGKGMSRAEIKMVTGLPFAHYRQDKEKYASQFLGNHELRVNGIKVSLQVSDCHVEVEGALKELLSAGEKYIYPDAELEERYVLGVSIGEGDTSWVGIGFDKDINPSYEHGLCWNFDKGIGWAKQKVIDAVRKEGTKIDRFDIDRAMARTHRKGEIDLKSGKTYNIIPTYGNALYGLYKEILGDMNDHLEDSGHKGRIRATFLYGGGSEFICNLIARELHGIIGGDVLLSRNPKTIIEEWYFEKAKLLYGEV
ncbi:MAG: ParM/StbA family protein [Candidatus Magnetobacterium sp. LHC-1]